jgi:hypothetical protein
VAGRTPPALLTVGAWIRLRIPPVPAPMMLTAGPPPPPEPPLAGLVYRAIPTDPRPRFFVLDEQLADGVLHLSWNADDPEHLDAELRVPSEGRHVPPEVVGRFWEAVRRQVAPLGPVRVEGADPKPVPRSEVPPGG